MTDRHDIWFAYVELTHRYADAVDQAAGDEVAALFTADARWDGTEFGLAPLDGTGDLVRHFSGGDGASRSVHLVHNHQLDEVSPSRVGARSYSHSMLRRDSGVRHLIVGYEDVLVPVDGDWRFAERVLRRVLSY